jgi:hypothetical protein
MQNQFCEIIPVIASVAGDQTIGVELRVRGN